MEHYNLNVINNFRLPASINGRITRLEGSFNFKPHIGLLPNGDIIMFVAHSRPEERTTVHTAKNSPRALASHVVMYKSYNSGKSWGWAGTSARLPEDMSLQYPLSIMTLSKAIILSTVFICAMCKQRRNYHCCC